MTNSFEDAVRHILNTKKPVTEACKKAPVKKKSKKVVKEVAQFNTPGTISGGVSTGALPAFQQPDEGGLNVSMLDIGHVEDKIGKNHSNPIFPLEQIPINLMNSGDAITQQLVNIEMALKNNKVLTKRKKEALLKAKDVIKSVLGNIRKAASIVDEIQK